MKLAIDQGAIHILTAHVKWVGEDAFVASLNLREKHAGGEIVTSGALQQIRLFSQAGTIHEEGVEPIRKSTCVTLDEPGWLLGITVSRYTAVITGVRAEFDHTWEDIELVIESDGPIQFSATITEVGDAGLATLYSPNGDWLATSRIALDKGQTIHDKQGALVEAGKAWAKREAYLRGGILKTYSWAG